MSDASALERDLQSWFSQWHVDDPSVFEEWIGSMRHVSFTADELLVKAGDRVSDIFLVKTGLLRLFYTTDDGKERNKAFFGAGQITGAVSAAMSGNPAPFSIQALEQGDLIAADLRILYKMAPSYPEASDLFIRLLFEAFVRNEQREALFLTCNAEQRYRRLLEDNPALVRRLPQFHIASYLGVDAVSLSRIKSKLDLETDDD